VSALDAEKARAVESARLLEQALEEVSLGVLLADKDRRITHLNGGFTRLTGYSEAELLGRSCRILHGPETDPGMAEKLRSSLGQTGIFDGDILNYRKDGTTFWNALLISPIHDAHGELSGFIGIQRDVTDRNASEAALARSEELLRANRDRLNFLVSTCPTVIYTASPTGEFPTTFISANVKPQLGYEPEQFTSNPGFWASRIHPEDASRIADQLQALFEHGHHSDEYRFRSSAGDYRWTHDEMLLKRDTAGNPTEIIGYWTDVTARHIADLSLRESEERLRIALTAAAAIAFVWDAASDSVVRYFSTEPALPANTEAPEPVAAVLARVHKDDRSRFTTSVSDCLASGTEYQNNYRIVRPDGTVCWLEEYGTLSRDGDGRPLKLTGISIDVTERNQARETMQQILDVTSPAIGTEYFRALVDFLSLNCGVEFAFAGIIDPKNPNLVQTIAVSQNGKSIDNFSYDLADTPCEHVFGRKLCSFPSGVAQRFPKDLLLVEMGIDGYLGIPLWSGSGEPLGIIVLLSKRPIPHPEQAEAILKVVAARGGAELERKLVDRALRASEERYRQLFESNPQPMWVYDLETLAFMAVNETAIAKYGYSRDEFLARTIKDIRPSEDVAALLDKLGSITSGLDEAGVWRHQLKNGQLIWVRITSHTLTFDGRPAEVVLAQDVTDQLRAEESLRASEERFRQAFEYSGVGMALVSPDGQFLRVNASLQSILGYTEAELLQTDCVAVTAPDDREADKQWVEPMLAGQMEQYSLEKRYLRSDGRVVWVLLTVSIVRDHAGGPVYFVAQFQDVTARRAAEVAVRESEERLRIFVENAPVGVAMLDRELRYISYSRRWLTDYGLGEQNLVGRTHYEVFPEITDRWKEIHRRCLTGVSERCEQDRFDRGDGSLSYLRWEIQPWYDAAGAVGGLVFFTELITDRVKAEEKVQASLREKESLLKEIHHRVKNNLQIITSLLNLQAETVQDPTALKLLRASQNRVRSMALVHETLYRSGDFGRIDLGRYFAAICHFLSRAYEIDNSRIRIEVHADDVFLDLDRAIPCGLIINELISNALKYAFPENQNGRITVRLAANSDQDCTLFVTDDGVGLPPDLDLGRLQSLGLQLVNLLVLQLHGSIIMEPAPGTGYCIRFPAKFRREQRQ